MEDNEERFFSAEFSEQQAQRERARQRVGEAIASGQINISKLYDQQWQTRSEEASS